MNQLLYKGKKRTLPHERSTSSSKRRKTYRGTSSTGKKNRGTTEDNQRPKVENDRLQYFNKFGFGSVKVSKILRESVTVRLRFCSKSQTSVMVRLRFASCKKPRFRFRFRFRLVKNPCF